MDGDRIMMFFADIESWVPGFDESNDSGQSIGGLWTSLSVQQYELTPTRMFTNDPFTFGASI